jgi:PAS domain S-box-containing protein
MDTKQIIELVEGTADAAFAVDEGGFVSAWNKAAENLFGLTSIHAIGKCCHEIIQGADEEGVVCSERCAIQQAVHDNQPPVNFDTEVETSRGRRWCNLSIVIVTEEKSRKRHSMHIVRMLERHKRLERLIRDFLSHELENARTVSGHKSECKIILTPRELEILRLLGNGNSTESIARQLYISEATVANHVKHILTKLSVHTRLEAIRYAERVGLI